MKRYWEYLKYVLRHKWFVSLECFKRGLIWQGIMHDMSKFLPSEFIPYAKFFYASDGSKINRRDSTGYYKPDDTGDKQFDFAWLLHQKRNRHHWQWWILPKDDGTTKCFRIPKRYVLEMICDWRGAGKAQGVPMSNDPDNWAETRNWFLKNKNKMTFHPDTLIDIFSFLDPEGVHQ